MNRNQFSWGKIVLPEPLFVPEKNPEISVLVLTHNQWRFTDLCLRALSQAQKKCSLRVEYIVVDNASSDGTQDRLARIPGLRLIPLKKNLGFGQGNNRGIQAAKGKSIVLLNNDVLVAPAWLSRLHGASLKEKKWGILGPCTNTESGQRLEVSYHTFEGFLALNRRLGRRRGLVESPKISGLCMMLSRAMLNKIGLFDPGFGMGYFEDDDLGLRAVDGGFKILCAQNVFVHHHGSASFAKAPRGKDFYLQRGMNYFVEKWGRRGLDHLRIAHEQLFELAHLPVEGTGGR